MTADAPASKSVTVDPGQSEVIDFLASGAAFDSHQPPRRIDTHASSVFLAGDRAWKLKRAVRLPYLDLTTPAKRRLVLERELELNRRTAPEFYLAVRPVTRDALGVMAIDGGGEIVDWLLEMRRFGDGALLSELAEECRLAVPLLMRLTDRIVSFHRTAATSAETSGAAHLRQVIDGNFAAAAIYPHLLDPARLGELRATQLSLLDRHARLLDLRAQQGRIRHCHGDLHLRNIALCDGEPTLFDCLEFDDELATIDVLYDLAFLLMDLWQRRLTTEANVVFNRYVDLSPADESAMALLPLMMSVRALVRAHVEAVNACPAETADGPELAARYLAVAEQLLEPQPLLVIAIGGLSGTGKSTLARAIAGRVGSPPGARVLRTDVVRKQLAGVAPEVELAASSYSAANSGAVYAEIERRAEPILRSGHSVTADGVFGRRKERASLEAVASAHGADFYGFWLVARRDTRLSRIAARGPDASDATTQVAIAQELIDTGPMGKWRVIATMSSSTEAAKVLLAALPKRYRKPGG